MRSLILVNASAGAISTLGAEAFVEKLNAAAAEVGWSCETVTADVAELADRASRVRDVDAVLCAGGDGTIAAIAYAMIGHEAPFVPLPCGTMNLFCRDLGLPADPADAVRAALGGAPLDVDVGVVETPEDGPRAFLNNIVLGTYADLAEAREKLRESDSAAATGAAIVEAAAALANAQPRPHLVTLDGQSIVIDTNTLVIANNRYTECIDLAPRRARLDEGLLALYLVKAEGAASFAARILDFLRGTLEHSSMIDLYTGRHCVAEVCDEPTAFAVDGERRETTGTVDMTIRQGALRVLAPRPSQEQRRRAPQPAAANAGAGTQGEAEMFLAQGAANGGR